MKRFIRRLSRVADASSHYCLLRSVPIYVGEEMELFVVNAELLNHPVFIALLNKSAQEYGYEQKGVLHIPCHVLVFERVMEALRLGVDSRDLKDLLASFSDDCFLGY
ncbi:hypothetical protein Gotri_011362 [Gossypium trilobum]|uniref:Auxin-responsive family protein n=1 Tax=Gossypium trilobum TaxID=34281 RepID=A0A7J9ETI2_9ROSI|nr:hypothetical protein [Gossypium trilobum]